MLKLYLASQGISVYRLAKESHVPYSTLNDLVNHKLPVENMRCGQLRAIADALTLDMGKLYDMCLYQPTVTSDRHHIRATIVVEHKTYVLEFEKDGVMYKSEILPVKREATEYLDTLALWKLDEVLDNIEMEQAYETICS